MKKKKIILSILMLANAVFVPTYDAWGGLFPSNPDDNILDVIESIFEGDLGLRVVQFSGVLLLSALLMLAFSVTEKDRGFKITAGLGTGYIIFLLVAYVPIDGDISELVDFDDGNIAIGTWIGLALLIVSFFIEKIGAQKDDTPKSESIYCLHCGEGNSKKYVYCRTCGKRLK